jgi:ATP-dependent DNA ligase
MEARTAAELPAGDQWLYEPKWDGFRALAFRDGDTITLQSKAGKPLTRYFPDIVAQLERVKARRFVLDGEIVVPVGERLSFDELLLRVHPAESRVRSLAEAHPARFLVFDLLADERGRSLTAVTLEERRPRLEAFAKRFFPEDGRVVLSRASRQLASARSWLQGGKGDLDGVIAKRLDLPYRSGERDGMVKVKRQRTADCVVGGFRYASKGGGVGSLLLGLYDRSGLLNHVGFTSSLRAEERKGLTARLEGLIQPPGFTGRAPGGPSRWSTERSTEWQPLAPKLVVEVGYDHVSGGRFRHGTRFLRWRPDKRPAQCTTDQLSTT